MDLRTIITACINLVTGILNAVLYFLIPRPVITDDQANRRDSHLATQFIQKFEEKYGVEHPDFFQGTLSEALERAKRDLRFAMVILQTDEHDNTAKFNRETLTSDILLTFLREHNVLVWAGDIKDPEAYQATTFPFVAVIVAQIPQGSAGSSPKLLFVTHYEGYSTPENLIAILTMSIERYGQSLQRIRNERAEHEAARQIRAQQDDAYLASLRADQEKERIARELVETQRLTEERARKEEEARQLLALNRENWRQWTLKNLPDEPLTETEVAKLSFRLANGERVVRKFRATDTVETVYNFVDTYYLRNTSSSSNVSEPSPDYIHTFDFLLVSPYPRSVYHADKFKEIQNEQGLWPSANLIVEESTADDDE
ncbi:9093_t:CDS:2 [Funneliformis geosporum]|uniref:13434_t:CDS:1 n=1 Tax=Funneliformis geosporum TaxID=1117311 RepID=A0A9W4SUQ0_9GLOM|nr:9093_t:CDS:2 [Funneliformis geosporum]CAI2181572.1 13434_t:CDS:2 [Funneliformis geosporum]